MRWEERFPEAASSALEEAHAMAAGVYVYSDALIAIVGRPWPQGFDAGWKWIAHHCCPYCRESSSASHLPDCAFVTAARALGIAD